MRDTKPTPETVSGTDYQRHVAMASSTKNYFMFRECYLDIMSRDAALVLQKLINRYGYLVKTNAKQDDWFVYTARQLKKSLRMEDDCQTRVLNELRGADEGGNVDPDRAFITTSKKGFPPKRHIRINYLVLNKALDVAQNGKKPNDREIPANGESSNDREIPLNGKSRRPMTGKSRRHINSTTNVVLNQKSNNPPSEDASRSSTSRGHQESSAEAERVVALPKKGKKGNRRIPAGGAAPKPKKEYRPLFVELAERLHAVAERDSEANIKFYPGWATPLEELWETLRRDDHRLTRIVEALERHGKKGPKPVAGMPKIRHSKQLLRTYDWVEDKADKPSSDKANRLRRNGVKLNCGIDAMTEKDFLDGEEEWT